MAKRKMTSGTQKQQRDYIPFPPIGNRSFLNRDGFTIIPNKKDYEVAKARAMNSRYQEALKFDEQYTHLIKQYGKDSEQVYDFEKKELGMYRHKRRRLEGTLAIIGLVAGIFFLSPSFTGSAVGNISNSTSNLLAVVLLILGLISSFLFFRKK